jgi:asparagine synthase (glutamine-hydrolysing)
VCGITGFLDLERATAPDVMAARVDAMTRTLAHRGPDGEGEWTDAAAGMALGQRRLAIVDLSPAGHQPMLSGNGRLVISYNGEVYNAAELREELAAAGHSFRGHSDTEVIVEGCVFWGIEGCVERLIGMFAFALWDRERRELWLVRDRVGIKPLYWARFGRWFVFGSELKALRAFPYWTPEIDRDALAGYVRHKCVAAPQAIYRGVHKLQAGHLLRVDARGQLRLHQYWDTLSLAAAARDQPVEPTAALVDRLEDLLSDAVRRRMIADVPLGSFLSGGIDSSTVVALMQRNSTRPVRSFSIGFHDPSYDEAVHARAVATHLRTDHTELYVEPHHVLDLIPNIPVWFDEPFADPSMLPTYLLSEMTRRHVTVALSGDGGDELFAGYERYFLAERLWRHLKWLPQQVLRGLGTLLQNVSIQSWDRLAEFAPSRVRPVRAGVKLHRLAESMHHGSQETLYRQILSDWPRPEELVVGAHEPEGLLSDPVSSRIIKDSMTRMQVLDVLTFLPDQILTKVDRASMAVGLEARVPLLDHRVVAFALGLPRDLKVRAGVSKWLLRQVLYRHVPPELVERPKKGFSVPLASWLRGPLREWAEHLLDRRRLRSQGLFEAQPIRGMWHAHRTGRQDWSTVLWNVLMFQSWLDRYGTATTRPDETKHHAPLAVASDRSVPLKRLASRIGSVGTPTP